MAEYINLDDLDGSQLEETVEIDTEVNPLEQPAPVRDGRHRFRLELAQNAWEPKETKPKTEGGPKKAFLACKFTLTCLEEGPDLGKKVYGRENTLVFNGGNRLAYIALQLLGGKDNPEAVAKVKAANNYIFLAQLFEEVTKGSPEIEVTTKWKAQVKETKNGVDTYRTVRTGMKSFPVLPNKPGIHNHIIMVDNNEVAAQAEAVDYHPVRQG